jgi:hypothetical protein
LPQQLFCSFDGAAFLTRAIALGGASMSTLRKLHGNKF